MMGHGFRRGVSAAVVLGGFVIGGRASADVVLPAAWSHELVYGYYQGPAPVLAVDYEVASGPVNTAITFNDGTISGYSTVTGVPAGAVSTGLSGSAGSVMHTGASLTYWLEVVGPDAASVPLTVTATLNAAVGLMDTAWSSASFSTPIGDGSLYQGYGGADTAGSETFNLTGAVQPNEVYMVSLLTNAYAVGLNSASASVDPTFTIDPGFADAGQYTVVLSDGVGNSVPEPAMTWFMALLAAGGVALQSVRRRQRSSSMTALQTALASPA